MTNLLIYVLISTSCLSVFYFGWHLLLRNNRNFNLNRAYLIVSILLSLLLPLTNYRIDIPIAENESSIKPSEIKKESNDYVVVEVQNSTMQAQNIDFLELLTLLYFTVTTYLLLRFLFHFIRILRVVNSNPRKRYDELTLIIHQKHSQPYSFFHFVFIDPDRYNEKEFKQVIEHERIHASQYHSADLMLIEFLTAVMWFNPIVIKFKNAMVLNHEYLADEGVLNISSDPTTYQALLLNEAAEGQLIRLSSSFSNSLIKKRITMITQTKLGKNRKIRFLSLLPITLLLFCGVSCLNGQSPVPIQTSNNHLEGDKIYAGIDNLIQLQTPEGINSQDIELKTENASVEKFQNNTVLHPKDSGLVVVSQLYKGEVIGTYTYVVLNLPEPLITIAGITKGEIKRKDLLAQSGFTLEFPAEKPLLNYEVFEYTYSTFKDSTTLVELKVRSGNFTAEVRKLMSEVKAGKRVYFESIHYRMPDGTVKEQGPIILKVI